ncbi:hypothetical protein WG906_00995 [Pedobacter sp. P351]|uniref:hypothetical protein n=1 Tax=Pedobacter superstes TaxID=3133441 RepID=UPI0030AF0E30
MEMHFTPNPEEAEGLKKNNGQESPGQNVDVDESSEALQEEDTEGTSGTEAPNEEL